MTQLTASSSTPRPRAKLALHHGSCHCGRVRFQAKLDARQGSRCNCSICTKLQALGAITKPSSFELLAGADALGTYEFGGKTMERHFCRYCGVHCYGRGHLAELGGDYVSVNLGCLDDADPRDTNVVYWDGRHDNWHAGPRPTPWPITP